MDLHNFDDIPKEFKINYEQIPPQKNMIKMQNKNTKNSNDLLFNLLILFLVTDNL